MEVWMARRVGAGFGHRAKSRDAPEVDATIPLESAVLAIPPQLYTRLAKVYEEWLGDGEE